MSTRARDFGIPRRSLFCAAFVLLHAALAKAQQGEIKRRPVDSSVLSSVGYDPLARVLEIEFRSGAIYRYLEVPEEVCRRLLTAESKGNFFGKNIRDKFRCERVKPRTTK